MKSLADRVRPLVIVAGRFVGLLAEIRVSYETHAFGAQTS